MNERRLAMMRMLDARKKVTARQLAEHFGVSVRTIQRDMERLQQMGFPLYTEVGAGGGYRVLPNRMLPPLQLNLQEALGLFLMLVYLERIPDMPYGKIRKHLSEQYLASLPSDVQEQIAHMRQHVAFHPCEIQTVPRHIITTELLEAAMQQRKIRFRYSAKGGDKWVEVFPIGIYLRNGYWYMPAEYKKDRILLYRVDRIAQLELLEKAYTTLPTLASWLQSEDERPGIEVELRFTEFGARMAASDEHFFSITNQTWRGMIPQEELPYTARRLMAYGPEVKVIESLELQNMVKDLLARSLANYEH